MKSISAKKLLAILKANGFVLVRQKGSHMIWKNIDGIMVPVPLHGTSKPIPIGTLLSIIKQTKIPKEKFR